MSTPASPAVVSASFTRTTMRGRRPSRPPRRGAPTTVTPESTRDRALHAGADERRLERSIGTAWRCMFEPMSARFASSCSRNGISDAATDTICFGDTSMYWILSGVDRVNSFW